MSEQEDEAEMTYSADQVQQLLRCPVCLDRFNQPKILPCQHTFCKSPCLEGLIDHINRKIKCPECRKEHFVPHGGAAAYPTNITIANFLDLPAQRVSSVRESENVESLSGNANQCGVCETECETTKCFHCNKMVCLSCKRSHTGQLRLDISRLVSQVRRGIPKFSTAISAVEQKSEEMKQHAETVKADIRDQIEKCVRELRDREKMLQSEVDTYLQGELRSLRLHQENIEVELASVTSFCDSTESLLNQAELELPEADMVALRRQSGEYLEQVRNVESDSLPHCRTVRFQYSGDALVRNIVSLGEVVIHNTVSQSAARSSDQVQADASRSQENQPDGDNERQRWEDMPPLDLAFFETLNDVQPAPSSTRTSRRSLSPPAQWQDAYDPPSLHANRISSETGTRHSYLGFAASPRAFDTTPEPRSYRDQNSSRYMYHMSLLEDFAQARRARERNNTSTIFGPDLSEDITSTGFTEPSVRDAFMDTYHGNSNNNTNNSTRSRNLRTSQNIIPFAPIQVTRDPRPAEAYELDADGNLREATLGQPIRPPNQFLSRRANYNSSDQTSDATAGQRTEIIQQENAAGMHTGEELTEERQVDEDTSHAAVHEQPGTSQPPQPLQRSPQGQSRNTDTALQGSDNENTPTNGRQTRILRRPRNDQNRTGSSNTANDESANTNTAAAGSSSDDDDDDDDIVIPQRPQRATTFVRQNGPSSNPTDVPAVQNNSVRFHVPVGIRRNPSNNAPRANNQNRSQVIDTPTTDYRQKGSLVRVIGNGRGSTQGQLKSPRGVAVTDDDLVVVADSSNHRVQVFSLEGQLEKAFGSYGDCNGEFDCLSGVSVTSSGHVIIADRYNHRVQKFNLNGEFIRSFGVEGNLNGRFSYPWGVATDGSDYIYVCDKENHRIQAFRPDGTFVRKFGCLGNNPGQLENPHYLTITRDNKVVVSDTNNHRIQVFTNQGRLLHAFGLEGSENGKLKSPKGVAVDNDGFILVVDSGNKRVQVFRGDGRYFCKFALGVRGQLSLKDPEGIALTSQGHVIVADKDNHRVCVF